MGESLGSILEIKKKSGDGIWGAERTEDRWILGDLEIRRTRKYKYLGVTFIEWTEEGKAGVLG